MCTVAVVDLPSGGYLLGHNRDESRRRGRAAPPTVRESSGRRFLAPTDADASGTWITVNDLGLAVCMLNAADRDPARLPATPESRGRLALDLADCVTVGEVHERIERFRERIRAVRAFHLVAIGPGRPGEAPRAERHRWDGADLEVDRLSPPALFVSALLDQDGAERARGRSWSRYLERRDRAEPDALAGWLAGHEPAPGMLATCVHRADARTVSRTLVRVSGEGAIEVRYLDGQPCDPAACETRHVLDDASGGQAR